MHKEKISKHKLAEAIMKFLPSEIRWNPITSLWKEKLSECIWQSEDHALKMQDILVKYCLIPPFEFSSFRGYY